MDSAEEAEDRAFEAEYGIAYGKVNYREMAHVLSTRLRQMDKRAKAANKRADKYREVLLKCEQMLYAEDYNTNFITKALSPHKEVEDEQQ